MNDDDDNKAGEQRRTKLVKAGVAPLSSNRSTRAVRTWVLPVPADADSDA